MGVSHQLTNPEEFRIDGQLPQPGMHLIEASAGTGKTYALSGLVARYVAEQGVPIDQILLVTFSKAAAAELRERVRARLADVLAGLEHRPSEFVMVANYRNRSEDEQDTMRSRLRDALAQFDTATIATVHTFCGVIRASAGVLSDATSREPGDQPHGRPTVPVVMLDDVDELIHEVAADWLANRSMSGVVDVAADNADGSDGTEVVPVPLPKLSHLVNLLRSMYDNPDATLDLGDEEVDPASALLAEAATEALAELRHRMERAGLGGYPDMLTTAATLVRDSEQVRTEMRNRYRVVFVDEFQDTDPLQWAILSQLFGEGTVEKPNAVLVLVGDPKQAIYRFRGGDIETYQAARQRCALSTQLTNWRADQQMVGLLNDLFESSDWRSDWLLHPEIEPSPLGRRLQMARTDGTQEPALVVRLAIGQGIEAAKSGKSVMADSAREAVYVDLANQVARLLDGETIIRKTGSDGTVVERPLAPSGICVTVAANARAEPIRLALAMAGVPAVITRPGSMAASPAFGLWRLLAWALERPSDGGRVRRLAMSELGGKSIELLDVATDAEIAELQNDLQRWSELLGRSGIVAAYRQACLDWQIPQRVVALDEGRQMLADLDRISTILHSLAPGPQRAIGVSAALDRLAESSDEEHSRLAESDRDAVSIMTGHASKGLEFDVVCAVGLSDVGLESAPVLLSGDGTAGRRVDYRLTRPKGADLLKELSKRQNEAEAVRRAYVALTRARHQTIVWWVPGTSSIRSGLAAVLMPAITAGAKPQLPSLEEQAEVIGERVRGIEGATVTVVGEAMIESGRAAVVPPAAVHRPTARRIGRTPDRTASRWSFSRITRVAQAGSTTAQHGEPRKGAHSDGAASIPPPADRTTADMTATVTAGTDLAGSDLASIDLASSEPLTSAAGDEGIFLPLAFAPAGAAFGTLVHEAFEHADFASQTLRDDLARWIGAQPLTDIDATELADGLVAAIETPLGDAFANISLRDLTRRDRLDEMEFELPLSPRQPTTIADIGHLICRHLSESDPMRPWAERVADGYLTGPLAGFLTGSIDGLFRITHSDGVERFHVFDYKTNWLGRPSEPLSLDDYRPDRLPDAMAHHDYPLQALLYLVATHRFLALRLPGYRPEQHLGSAGYLFIRGMVGADSLMTEGTAGVCAWLPPVALVTELSEMLSAGPLAAGAVGSAPSGRGVR